MTQEHYDYLLNALNAEQLKAFGLALRNVDGANELRKEIAQHKLDLIKFFNNQ